MNFTSDNDFNNEPNELTRQNEPTTPAIRAVDRLKAAAQATAQVVEEIPYLPTVYAIPKEDWEAFRHGLREVLTFQPTLYEQIGDLATREEMNEVLEANWDAYRSLANLASKKIGEETAPLKTQLGSIREALEQDGKKRERIISDLEWSARQHSEEMRETARSVKHWTVGGLIASVLTSGLVSLLVSLLLR